MYDFSKRTCTYNSYAGLYTIRSCTQLNLDYSKHAALSCGLSSKDSFKVHIINNI